MRNITRWIGNILLGLSLFGFLVTALPFIKIYFFPPHIIDTQLLKDPYITIPKINAQAKIIEQVDPWNETEYKKALTLGVAQAKGTALPGGNGTSFLFAHSSGLPWEETENNTIFLRLGELQKRDKIIITKNKDKYEYTVKDKKIIWPSEVNYLLENSPYQLILQTCTPIGTSLKRLLVFATKDS